MLHHVATLCACRLLWSTWTSSASQNVWSIASILKAGVPAAASLCEFLATEHLFVHSFNEMILFYRDQAVITSVIYIAGPNQLESWTKLYLKTELSF